MTGSKQTASSRNPTRPSRWKTPCTKEGCSYLGIAALVDRDRNVYWRCLKHAGIDDPYGDYTHTPYGSYPACSDFECPDVAVVPLAMVACHDFRTAKCLHHAQRSLRSGLWISVNALPGKNP